MKLKQQETKQNVREMLESEKSSVSLYHYKIVETLFSRWHKHTNTHTHTHIYKHTKMEVVHETLLSLSMALKETENRKKIIKITK